MGVFLVLGHFPTALIPLRRKDGANVWDGGRIYKILRLGQCCRTLCSCCSQSSVRLVLPSPSSRLRDLFPLALAPALVQGELRV